MRTFIGLLALVFIVSACTQNDIPASSADADALVENTALQFVQSLTEHDYARAYGMTSKTYRQRISRERMQQDFEYVIPQSWSNLQLDRDVYVDAPVQEGDVGSGFVTIYGEVTKEGAETYDDFEVIQIFVSAEQGIPVVRDAEFGRLD